MKTSNISLLESSKIQSKSPLPTFTDTISRCREDPFACHCRASSCLCWGEAGHGGQAGFHRVDRELREQLCRLFFLAFMPSAYFSPALPITHLQDYTAQQSRGASWWKPRPTQSSPCRHLRRAPQQRASQSKNPPQGTTEQQPRKLGEFAAGAGATLVSMETESYRSTKLLIQINSQNK